MIMKFFHLSMILLLIGGCSAGNRSGEMDNAGLLVPETIDDGVWGTKGYQGLLGIQKEFDVKVYYKEGMKNEASVRQAIDDFEKEDVNLVFGHGSEYSSIFNEVASEHKDMHLVSFNGDATQKNTTSLTFKGYAMGFFGGMTAASQTKTDRLGIIAAFSWQPEVQGFIDGARYQNSEAEVLVDYTGHWDHAEVALERLDGLLDQDVDVVYPAGDGYNVAVIEKLKESGRYAIGYVSDQSDLGESTVLTSTVQHADKLYELIAGKYTAGELESGNLEFDFQDGVISMGEFSPVIPDGFKSEMNQHIKAYVDTGKLPNGKEPPL
ncbi:BMP family ABC transporter substrate-binding protein [Rossellomorea marisflavi]|uniref:Transcriptional regulator n=1 Tax=Rossellomorea marisflavi TaxID=189381 RepID=A0A161TFC4_9BACI|nr:transcriptional regulator [Rossellomorea marisflavi]